MPIVLSKDSIWVSFSFFPAGWSSGLDLIFFVGRSAEKRPDLAVVWSYDEFLSGEPDEGSLELAPLGDLTMSSRSTLLP